eukprot:821388-Pelagomonas_calceolata.AAC.1
MIPAHDRDIHLVELKFCLTLTPYPAYKQLLTSMLAAGTISRLRTRSLRNPNRNNKVTLYTILLGVA